LAMKKVQLQRLDAEFELLDAGKSEKGLFPTPMVYPIVDEVLQKSIEPVLLRITVCSFCDLPFPNSNIVVASCKHVYHPWCGQAVFGQGSRCVDVHCQATVHPDWHRSFGWGKPNLELEELAKRLQCDEENVRLLSARAEKARVNCPYSGKNAFEFTPLFRAGHRGLGGRVEWFYLEEIDNWLYLGTLFFEGTNSA